MLKIEGVELKRRSLVFSNLNLAVKKGEHILIVGANGSGKSSLLELIEGTLNPSKGEVKVTAETLRRIGPFTFYRQKTFRDAYYQARYNSIETDSFPTVKELIGEVDEAFLAKSVLEKPLIALSSGEARKLLMLKAQRDKIDLLLIDEPYLGLDIQAREELSRYFENLRSAGTTVVAVSAVDNTHSFDRKFKIEEGELSQLAGGIVSLSNRENAGKAQKSEPLSQHAEALEFEPSGEIVFECSEVSLSYNDQKIIGDFSWTLRRGESWVLSGPNGSGKSTILSLILADNPQSYRERVKLFGRRRGSGESIWEIKERVGYLSPELHAYFDENLTVIESIASGLTTSRSLAMIAGFTKDPRVMQLAEHFALGAYRDTRFGSLSFSEQRRVLIARSLVRSHDILIFDEPFQGMSNELSLELLKKIKQFLRPSQTFVLVTHEETELPAWINKRLAITGCSGAK